MNIDLSQIIWTIICFLLFTLVLNGLLIKPILKFTDERRAKIEKAHAEAEELKKARAEAAEKERAQRELAAELAEEENKKRLAIAAESTKEELINLAERLKEREAAELEEINRTAAYTDERLEAALDSMAAAFTEKLRKGGES